MQLEYDYLKTWNQDDLVEEHKITGEKVKLVLKEQKHLDSLLDSLRDRSFFIRNLLVNNP
jgi:hypothetical protein